MISIADVQTDLFNYDSSAQRLTLRLKGHVPMAFMSIAGINQMDAIASATVKSKRAPPVEAVLVLDTTYSMVGSKIDTLKTAAKRLSQSILMNADARVGVVPFSYYVNVGVSRRDEPGFSVPPDSSSTYQSCSTSYPNANNCTTTTSTSARSRVRRRSIPGRGRALTGVAADQRRARLQRSHVQRTS